jgi:hypothetical protein
VLCLIVGAEQAAGSPTTTTGIDLGVPNNRSEAVNSHLLKPIMESGIDENSARALAQAPKGLPYALKRHAYPLSSICVVIPLSLRVVPRVW